MGFPGGQTWNKLINTHRALETSRNNILVAGSVAWTWDPLSSEGLNLWDFQDEFQIPKYDTVEVTQWLVIGVVVKIMGFLKAEFSTTLPLGPAWFIVFTVFMSIISQTHSNHTNTWVWLTGAPVGWLARLASQFDPRPQWRDSYSNPQPLLCNFHPPLTKLVKRMSAGMIWL